MKEPLFLIARYGVRINKMTLSHIFRNGDGWTVVTGSGSQYDLNEEEYNQLIESYKPEEHKPHFDIDEFGKMLAKFKEIGLKAE